MSLKLWCIFVLEPFTLSLGLCLFLIKKKKKMEYSWGRANPLLRPGKNTGRPRNNNRDSRMRPRNQYIREPTETYKKKLIV